MVAAGAVDSFCVWATPRDACSGRTRAARWSPGWGWLEERNDGWTPLVSGCGWRACAWAALCREWSWAAACCGAKANEAREMTGREQTLSVGLGWAANGWPRGWLAAEGGEFRGVHKTSGVGLKQKRARNERKGKNKKEKVFYFGKLQTNESKYKFEFQHSIAMHQHVWSIKLL